MSYDPKVFWEQRLGEHFDLVGTGETGLSYAYNRACYDLRAIQLDTALAHAGVALDGKRVLDVGCGTGFFVDYYRRHGAAVTGLDLTTASVERLKQRFPDSRFILADVSDWRPDERFDIVNAFDVLYHITDAARWERAVSHLASAVAPGGAFVLTDLFDEGQSEAGHNVIRPLSMYRAVLEREGLVVGERTPTHVLLNRPLGPFRFLNRMPGLLFQVDRALLALGFSLPARTNRILVARRPAGGT